MKILPKNAEKNTFLSIYYFSVAAERANFGGYIVQVMEYTVVGAGGPPLSWNLVFFLIIGTFAAENKK